MYLFLVLNGLGSHYEKVYGREGVQMKISNVEKKKISTRPSHNSRKHLQSPKQE